MRKRTISIVLPAYNEEGNIELAVTVMDTYFKNHSFLFEIIVVDNGSYDKTGKIVRKITEKNKNIKLVTIAKNIGYGNGLRAGFSKAKYDLIFYTDSDNQYCINDLDKLLPLIDRCDIVSGFRIKRRDPFIRIFVGTAYNFLIRMFFGLQLKDVDCSFKLYKRIVFDKIFLWSNTGLIDAEILLKAKRAGFAIAQTGVNHYPRVKGKSSYELAGGNMFAFIKPQEVLAVLYEIKHLWKELHV